MSTFAVFGMTESAALTDARRQDQKHQAQRQGGLPPIELTLTEWTEAVQRNANAIMTGEKVKQPSALFDTPQHAQQFIELAKRAGVCRDLCIRCKVLHLDEKATRSSAPRPKCPLSAGRT